MPDLHFIFSLGFNGDEKAVMKDALYYRQQADHCRRLARGTSEPFLQIAMGMAEEFDRLAAAADSAARPWGPSGQVLLQQQLQLQDSGQ